MGECNCKRRKPSWWTSDHWETPPKVMDVLVGEFGLFDLDPCCRRETAKAPSFHTEEDSGLAYPWRGKVFLNPPYSKPTPWLEKAIDETKGGRASIVVALLPVRTDTRWFHRLVLGCAEIRFVQGRIRWLGWQGTPIPAPKNPSMLAIYRSVAEPPKEVVP